MSAPTLVQPPHPGGEGFVGVFEDESGEDRSTSGMAAFVSDLNLVALRYGFKLGAWGERSVVRQALANEQARLDRDDLAEMLADFRRRRAAAEAVE